MRNFISRVLSGFKYIVGLFLMYAGIATMLADTEPVGIIYRHKLGLVIMGVIVFASGVWLVLAKLFNKRKQVGHALMAVYLCFLFAGILNWIAFGFIYGVGNFVAAVVTGLLYLRWKYNILYSERVDRDFQPM